VPEDQEIRGVEVHFHEGLIGARELDSPASDEWARPEERLAAELAGDGTADRPEERLPQVALHRVIVADRTSCGR
jgi:hypothetical protein